ncbi:MAG: F0F1 ATP synthase subunit delta [Candidatus Omnitrophota bacterium]
MDLLKLVLLQVMTFVVIIILLRFFFGSQLKNALGRLQVLHQESLEKEEVLTKEIEKARIQAENEIARSKETAKAILEEARQAAEKVGLEAVEQAQAQAKKIIAETQERAKKIEIEVRAETEKKAIGLARELIGLIFSSEGQERFHRELIDELIDDLGQVDKERLAIRATRAEVSSSVPLSPEEKKKFSEVLFSRLGHNLPIDESVDPGLIMGMVLKLGGLVIDGSLKNKLHKAMLVLNAQEARKAASREESKNT